MGVLEELEKNLEKEIDSLESRKGDITMGREDLVEAQRQSHPIAGLETLSNLTGELHERLECLERELTPMLTPEMPASPEQKDASSADARARSPVMHRLEATESKLRACIGYLNSIIDRLDL